MVLLVFVVGNLLVHIASVRASPNVGKGFMGRSHYYDHVAAHTGVKRHACSICEKKFMNKSSLNVHVLHFHPTDTAHIL